MCKTVHYKYTDYFGEESYNEDLGKILYLTIIRVCNTT